MDQNLRPKENIQDYVAYPKDWQREGKYNQSKPFKAYPLQPLIVGKNGKLEPIGGMLNPLTFQNAREETEYLKANPDMAEKIAEARARTASASDKLAASNDSMRKLAAKHQEIVGERNALEGENSDLRDQLAAAKAELEAARAERNGASPQVQTDDAPGTPRKRGRPASAVKAAQAAGAQG